MSNSTDLNRFTSDSEIINNDEALDPDGPVPETMPERSEELEKIHRVLAPIARGSSAKNRLIFGKPGQGKTAAVKLKTRQMKSELAETEHEPNFLYVSCKEHPTSYAVTQALIQLMSEDDEKPKGYQLSELYDKVYSLMETISGAFVMVLDEVDSLQQSDSKYDEEGEPNILYKFPRSRSTKGFDGDSIDLGIIGISNDRRFRKQLSSRCMDALGDSTINFKPYSKAELVQILKRRASTGLQHTSVENGFESDVVGHDEIEECARLASRERGSARQALRYLSSAASIAESSESRAIEREHIEKAEAEVREEYVHATLTDHTEDDWLVLCGVLWCVAVEVDQITTGEIHSHYQSVCSALDERTKVQRRMRDRLKDLDLTGVIDFKLVRGGKLGGDYYTADLKLPLGETLQVMENQDPFQDKLSEIAREIKERAQSNGVL